MLCGGLIFRMSRPFNAVKRPTISIRLREEIVNVSKDIPGFRKKLEGLAEELYNEWRAQQ
jgi:hypothetical protein